MPRGKERENMQRISRKRMAERKRKFEAAHGAGSVERFLAACAEQSAAKVGNAFAMCEAAVRWNHLHITGRPKPFAPGPKNAPRPGMTLEAIEAAAPECSSVQEIAKQLEVSVSAIRRRLKGTMLYQRLRKNWKLEKERFLAEKISQIAPRKPSKKAIVDAADISFSTLKKIASAYGIPLPTGEHGRLSYPVLAIFARGGGRNGRYRRRAPAGD